MTSSKAGYYGSDQLELMDLLFWTLFTWDIPCIKKSRLEKVWNFLLHAIRRDRTYQDFPKIRSGIHPDHIDSAILGLASFGMLANHQDTPSLICLETFQPQMAKALKEEVPQLVRDISPIALELSQEKITLKDALRQLRALRQRNTSPIPA